MNAFEQNWNKMAEAYERFTVGENSYSYRIEWPCIQEMLPDLEGKSVIDLGCGTGRFTFWLEDRKPSKIVGIDLAEDMLKLAETKAKELKSKAIFYKGDISRHFTDEKFDFVFSSTVSHFIVNLDDLFSNIHTMLHPGGLCVLSVMNPVYTAQYPTSNGETFPNDDDWTVRYLDKRQRSYVQPWIEYNDEIDDFLSFSYHHTFSDYVNSMIRCGFDILEVQEPLPPEEWKTRFFRRYDAFIKTPSYLIVKCKRLD